MVRGPERVAQRAAVGQHAQLRQQKPAGGVLGVGAEAGGDLPARGPQRGGVDVREDLQPELGGEVGEGFAQRVEVAEEAEGAGDGGLAGVKFEGRWN